MDDVWGHTISSGMLCAPRAHPSCSFSLQHSFLFYHLRSDGTFTSTVCEALNTYTSDLTENTD